MRAADYEPLVLYPGLNIPWKCRCGAAPPAARRDWCAMPNSTRSPSPMSIAMPSTRRSKSATIRRSRPSR